MIGHEAVRQQVKAVLFASTLDLRQRRGDSAVSDEQTLSVLRAKTE
jgi:hypothetical protein